MKSPTIEDLKKELEAANKRIEILNREFIEVHKVERIIIAAGLLTEEKFNEARSLLYPE